MLTSFAGPEAAAFSQKAREWLDEHVPQRWRNDRDRLTEPEVRAIRQEWDRVLYQGGYAGMSWPKEFGGQGLGPIEEYLFHVEAARADAPEGFGRVGRIMVGPTLIAHGTPEQQARFLPGILDGSEVWCQGFSEPGAGSDLAAVSTRAVADGDEFRLTGQKTWTSFAEWAHWCIVLARTGEAGNRHRNLTMFLVDMSSPGVTQRPIRQISGGSTFCEVFFDDVRVPRSQVLGDVDDGWKVAMTLLTSERGALDSASKFVLLLGDIDTARHCVSTMDSPPRREIERFAVLIEALNWQVMTSIESRLNGDTSWFNHASILKLYTSELWQELAQFGLTHTCPEHRDFWRQRYLNTRAASIYSGTSQIQRNIIATRVLGLPRS